MENSKRYKIITTETNLLNDIVKIVFDYIKNRKPPFISKLTNNDMVFWLSNINTNITSDIYFRYIIIHKYNNYLLNYNWFCIDNKSIQYKGTIWSVNKSFTNFLQRKKIILQNDYDYDSDLDDFYNDKLI